MFSTLRIDFLQDFGVDWFLTIGTRTSDGTLTKNNFTWVVTRVSPFEVEVGTPTGNPGERTALNLKTAYDLDNTIGATTVAGNSGFFGYIEFTSTVVGETFDGIGLRDDNGGSIVLSATYNNVVPTPTATDVDLILTRSPHYVNVPYTFSETTASTLSLYVYDGDIATVPATASYVATQTRPAANFDEANFNISNYVNDFLDVKPNVTFVTSPSIIDSNTDSVKWIKYVATYTDEDNSVADIEGSFSALRGFGFYNQGVNPTKPANSLLTPCVKRKVASDGIILFPFINDGTNASFTVTTENLEVNSTLAVTVSAESTKYIQYVLVDVSDITTDKIITITDSNSNAFVYNIETECRYEPKQIVFMNRYGAFDSLTLFKKSSSTLSVTKDKFINNYLTNGVYDVTRHQMKDINIQAMQKLSVNSGYINEAENELYKDIMVSDLIYLYEDGNLTPLKLNKSSLEIKNRLNDGLVNYSLEFDYAFNYIQNV